MMKKLLESVFLVRAYDENMKMLDDCRVQFLKCFQLSEDDKWVETKSATKENCLEFSECNESNYKAYCEDCNKELDSKSLVRLIGNKTAYRYKCKLCYEKSQKDFRFNNIPLS